MSTNSSEHTSAVMPQPDCLWRGDYPDPAVLTHDGWFYVTHSSFRYAPGLLIWKSRDLHQWERVGFALNHYDGDVWAPDLAFHDGRFWLYYKATGGNRVLIADQMEGPWEGPFVLDAPLIDPAHVVDRQGRRFVYLSKGKVAELNSEGTKVIERPRPVYDGWPMPTNWRNEGLCLEGAKPFWHKDRLHVLWAQGGTGGVATSHMVVHTRGHDVEGPFENSTHSPLLRTQSADERWWSAGHGTAFQGPDQRWWLMYHAYEKGYHSLGRQTLVCGLRWTDDDWLELDPERRQPIPYASEPQSRFDPLDGDALDWRWQWFEHDGQGLHSLGSNDSESGLRLFCSGPSLDEAHPLTTMLNHYGYTIEVEVELHDDSAVPSLSLFYNRKAYHAITIEDNTPRIDTKPAIRRNPGKQSMKNQRWDLRIVNDHHEVAAFTRPSGTGVWDRIGAWVDFSGIHHNTFGQFLGVRAALTTTGAEGGSATFRNFRYIAKT